MTIGELSSRTGVATSALRYYEELGLMPRARRVSGQRRYDDSALRSVGVILLLRDVGFSLKEIKAFVGPPSRGSEAWRTLAQAKLAELDARIARAQGARLALEHGLQCRYAHLSDCPKFQAGVSGKLAGKPLHEAHRH
jgi:DNA-binding transcriptional MerR regulator